MNQTTSLAERAIRRFTGTLIELGSKLLLWPRLAKRAFVMVGDFLLGIAATWLAFSLRLGEWRLFDWPVMLFAGALLICWFPVALYNGVYNAIFRYAGRGSIIRLSVAMAMSSVPLVYLFMFLAYPGVPRTLAVLGPLIFLMMMGTARIIGRYVLVDLLHSRPHSGRELQRTLIYGAGSLGQRLAASFAAEPGMRLVGYVDDDPDKHQQRLDGFKVYSSAEIEEVIERTGATNILLAISDLTRNRKREIVDALSRYPVEVQVLPPMRELISGKVTLADVRPIQVEDLLGRPAVEPDEALLRRSVAGKRVMITGAGGSIGSEICRQVLALEPRQLILADSNEFALYTIQQEIERACKEDPRLSEIEVVTRLANVVDQAAVERLFRNFPPDTVFHAAAYKHVPLVEDNILAGVENNLFGTRNAARAAIAAGCERFILISTDKAVRPPNAMGASKRACEMYLQALSAEQAGDTLFAIVRFGNVLGSSGSVVPLFRQQISRGGPVTVTDRHVTRYFMTIPEAAQLVIQAAGMAEGGEVYVLDMGEPVKIMDLARSMIKLAGLTVREETSPLGEIEIVEIGLRPGEKLFEELLIGDHPLPTSHPRILRARESYVPLAKLTPQLEALQDSIVNGDPGTCRKLLGKLVPTLSAEIANCANDRYTHVDSAEHTPHPLVKVTPSIPASQGER